VWRAQGKVVVWTNGCFDLLHMGHVHSLQAARSLGDVLVVGTNSDHSVRCLKRPGRPVIPASERVEILAALESVDHVVVFDELTPNAMLSNLKPDVHCKGAEYAPPHSKPIPEAKVVESYGGRVMFLPWVPSFSTSNIIRRVRTQGGGTTAKDEAQFPDAVAWAGRRCCSAFYPSLEGTQAHRVAHAAIVQRAVY
jgi:rfaE bifunctional protein nucleotidyltransferase chain/domain